VRSRLLQLLDPEDAKKLMAVARRRKFAKGEVVFHEGDPGDTIHLLETGHVAVRVTTPLGDSALLRVIGPGDFFGELSVIAPAPRVATITAIEAVETLSLHRDHIDELRRTNPTVDAFLLEVAVSEVRRLSLQLLDALYVPVPKRVLRRVLEVSDLFSGTGGEAVSIPFTQDDIAELAGTSRPTANRVLREAQDEGLLQIARGRIVVQDATALAKKAR
jgi:CRP/FNR family transcriptional regulator, cyclic AMP receptor protein